MKHSRIVVRSFSTLALAFAALGIGVVGCSDNGISSPFGGERVTADVDLAGEMTVIEASSNAHSQTGVKHLRVENWSAAEDELEQAVEDNQEDWRSQYALGVAYEMQEKYDEALEAYQNANLHVGKEGRSDITAAVLRTKARTER